MYSLTRAAQVGFPFSSVADIERIEAAPERASQGSGGRLSPRDGGSRWGRPGHGLWGTARRLRHLMFMDERPREVELKLELPAREVERLKRAFREDPHLAEPPRTDLLVSTYFDTDRRDLRDAGVSLRVRREGRRRTQTIKQTEAPAAGSFDRAEWERDIAGDKPDLKSAEGTALAPLLSRRVRARLKPVFRTAVNRTTYRLGNRGSAVKLAFDRGRIEAGRRSSPLAEVEIELERGEPAELFALARRLGAREPPRLQIKSKAERGYDLIASAAPAPVKFAKLKLARGTSSAQAFRLIAHACLRQLVANELAQAGVRDQAEGVRAARPPGELEFREFDRRGRSARDQVIAALRLALDLKPRRLACSQPACQREQFRRLAALKLDFHLGQRRGAASGFDAPPVEGELDGGTTIPEPVGGAVHCGAEHRLEPRAYQIGRASCRG